MCMVEYADDGEQCVTRTDVFRKARKAHKCAECDRVIDAGERYHYITFVTVGQGYGSYSLCLHCQIVCDWLVAECHGYFYTLAYEDIIEHVEEHGMGVARLAAGMRMQWRHHGKLMREPKLPPTTHQVMA